MTTSDPSSAEENRSAVVIDRVRSDVAVVRMNPAFLEKRPPRFKSGGTA